MDAGKVEPRRILAAHEKACILKSLTAEQTVGYAVGHGRTVRVGQVWRANDPRRLKAVRVLGIDDEHHVVVALNLRTFHVTEIALTSFTVGSRGWSLEQQPQREPR